MVLVSAKRDSQLFLQTFSVYNSSSSPLVLSVIASKWLGCTDPVRFGMARRRRTSPSKRISPPRVAAKTGLRLLLPFLALTYAVMVWRSRRGKGGAIDFASSHGCFGSPVSEYVVRTADVWHISGMTPLVTACCVINLSIGLPWFY